MPRRRFRRSRGCGALRVGSAWRLARIIFLLVHACYERVRLRRGACSTARRLRFSDCATWASTRACKSGAAGVTRATPRATRKAAATPYRARLLGPGVDFGLLVSYRTARPLQPALRAAASLSLLSCTRSHLVASWASAATVTKISAVSHRRSYKTQLAAFSIATLTAAA